MNTARVWIFRALVLIGAGTFVYSFFAPWWIARCSSAVAGDGDVIVHPYGLDDGGSRLLRICPSTALKWQCRIG